jgi:predicted secreted protein
MAARKMVGKDNVLLIDPAGASTYKTVLCLTENSFKIANDIIDAKSKCGADKVPGAQSFEVSCSGFLHVASGATELDAGDLYTLASAQTTIGWKIGKATPVADDVAWSGTAFIANFDANFPLDGPATFSMTLGVYGTPTQNITP